ncbi:MAG: Coenzyme F420 hydrogenase/dehydrogenase, beta subunit C-terminal domain [Muribaculaceae bacterium]|nr:Coenzyme F420 hydrogenase/dehydrogenase, beta subunit C-terminal domain [Muribaculaceae bacterium]
MINISDKSRCCGCGACVQRCPQSCIKLEEDQQGFWYSVVDLQQCVNCHLCEQVCPFFNENITPNPIKCFAAVNEDQQIRLGSSSGGVFTLLAQSVIASGGVVFGARFDEEWHVVHDYADNMEGLSAFRGSKYVQSMLGDNYIKAEQFLKQGRTVLFSGTPCQIEGLKHYLGREYEELIAVEVVCHGVPSPMVWKEYLYGKMGKKPVSVVNFRDKTTGWKDYSVRIGHVLRRHDNDEFMGCFLSNYSLRPSCFNCPSKSGKSGADITLGDLWGAQVIAPSLDDNLGTSVVIANTEKGLNAVNSCGISKLVAVEYGQVVSHNPAICKSSSKPDDYDDFWKKFSSRPFRSIKVYGRRHLPSLSVRIKVWVYRLLKG